MSVDATPESAVSTQGCHRATLKLAGFSGITSLMLLMAGCPSTPGTSPSESLGGKDVLEPSSEDTDVNPQLAPDPNAPTLADPKFIVTKFAELPLLEPGLVDPLYNGGPDQQYALWSMVLSDGSRGIKPGILATTGPFPGERSSRVFHFNAEGKSNVLIEGFQGSQQLLWTTEEYAEAGALLVAEPISGKIRTILPGGEKLGILADLSPALPSGMAFGPDMFGNSPGQVLYVSDLSNAEGTKGAIWRVPPPGANEEASVVTQIALPQLPNVEKQNSAHMMLRNNEVVENVGFSVAKALTCACSGKFADSPALLASTFSVPNIYLSQAKKMNLDAVYSITDGGVGELNVAKAPTGNLNGLMFPAVGPGTGGFSDGVYMPMLGTPSEKRNGAVNLWVNGESTEFMANLNATSIIFDTTGVLGVSNAMYVAAFDPYSPGVIWRVVPA